MKLRSYKNLKGSWTKWGGARGGAVDCNQYDEVHGAFYCQTCGKENPPEITGYKVQLYDKEYIKVCGVCLFKGFQKVLDKRIEEEEDFFAK